MALVRRAAALRGLQMCIAWRLYTTPSPALKCGVMSQSAPNDELSRLEAQMKELIAESEVIQKRIAELKGKVHGVIDDTALIMGAEIIAPGAGEREDQK